MAAHLEVQARDQLRRFEPLVHERAQDGEKQRHQQRGGTAFAGHVAHRHHHPPVVERQDVVEVAADRVRRTAEAGRFKTGRVVRFSRQHRLLDLARDFEIVLEGQAVRDLEQHEQIHQRERDEERPGALAEHRSGHAEVDAKRQRRPDANQSDAAEQIDQADEREQQRNGVDQAAGRRQLHRERQEQQPCMLECPLVPRQMRERARIGAAREKQVGLARFAGEEPLQVVGGQILRVDVEERPHAGGSRFATHCVFRGDGPLHVSAI